MGEVPQWVPRPSWEAVDPAAPRLRQSCQQLRGRRWTRRPSATTMFGRKRSVSFGGFGWWVTDGRAGEGVEGNLAVKPGGACGQDLVGTARVGRGYFQIAWARWRWKILGVGGHQTPGFSSLSLGYNLRGNSEVGAGGSVTLWLMNVCVCVMHVITCDDCEHVCVSETMCVGEHV